MEEKMTMLKFFIKEQQELIKLLKEKIKFKEDYIDSQFSKIEKLMEDKENLLLENSKHKGIKDLLKLSK